MSCFVSADPAVLLTTASSILGASTEQMETATALLEADLQSAAHDANDSGQHLFLVTGYTFKWS